MKDNFSSQSDKYATYRPTYPPELFQYILSLVPEKHSAWDCGTGNGQVAFQLAQSFKEVFATDISKSQLSHAKQAKNITYSLQAAENTNFPDNRFNLITVAQAIHWFHFQEFYKEVNRTAKNDAVICVLGYSLISISPKIDRIIDYFYKHVIGSYWDEERTFIDENYETIPFPFNELKTPDFESRFQWDLNHFIGYINTWSAVKHYINKNNRNPVLALQSELQSVWPAHEKMEVTFPVLSRIGKITHK